MAGKFDHCNRDRHPGHRQRRQRPPPRRRAESEPHHRWMYTPSWIAWTSSRNAQQATATTTPRKAQATSSTRYRLLRSSALTGSAAARSADDDGASGFLCSLSVNPALLIPRPTPVRRHRQSGRKPPTTRRFAATAPTSTPQQTAHAYISAAQPGSRHQPARMTPDRPGRPNRQQPHLPGGRLQAHAGHLRGGSRDRPAVGSHRA